MNERRRNKHKRNQIKNFSVETCVFLIKRVKIANQKEEKKPKT